LSLTKEIIFICEKEKDPSTCEKFKSRNRQVVRDDDRGICVRHDFNLVTT